jgi:signal transduction histidine kinase
MGAFANALEGAGHITRSASSMREALVQLAEASFDLVISDRELGEDDGVTLIGHVKDLAPNTEVILLTDTGSVEDAVRAVRAGAFDFISAPLPDATLLTLVDRALEHRSLLVSSNLFQSSQAIFQNHDPESLPQVVVEVAMAVMRSDDASLMLPEDNGNLVIAYSHTLSSRPNTIGQAAGTVARRIAKERTPALLSGRLDNDPRFPGETKSEGVHSSIVYPLWSGNRLVGVLNLNRASETRPFHPGDLDTAAILASQAVLALENARLVRELRGRIVALEETQTRLIHSERLAAIGQIAAGVVHEINNPTSYLLANLVHVREGLELLRPAVAQIEQSSVGSKLEKWAGTPAREALEDLVQALVDAEDGAHRIRDIAQDLRVLSRTDPGEHSRIDLSDVLTASLRLARLSMGHEVEWRMEATATVHILGNARRLSQVFLNLLVNAAQAVHQEPIPDPWVSFRCQLEGDRVLVLVQDSGPGIPPEIRSRIFEPFFTTKPEQSGTGLGLAISRDIVEHHQGTIRCDSEPNEGTTFTVDLPLAPAAS